MAEIVLTPGEHLSFGRAYVYDRAWVRLEPDGLSLEANFDLTRAAVVHLLHGKKRVLVGPLYLIPLSHEQPWRFLAPLRVAAGELLCFGLTFYLKGIPPEHEQAFREHTRLVLGTVE